MRAPSRMLVVTALVVGCGPRTEVRGPVAVVDSTILSASSAPSVSPVAASPTSDATAAPAASAVPIASPSAVPIASPSAVPVASPSAVPVASPSAVPIAEPTTPAVTEPPALLPVDKTQRLGLPLPVLFREGAAVLELGSDSVLGRVVEHLRATPRVTRLRIEAHTETAGKADANLALSKARALTAARWLVLHGIECRRLVPVGFGGTRPRVVPEATLDDRAQNRRLDFVQAEFEGKAHRGLPLDGGGTIAGDPCR